MGLRSGEHKGRLFFNTLKLLLVDYLAFCIVGYRRKRFCCQNIRGYRRYLGKCHAEMLFANTLKICACSGRMLIAL